MPFLIDQQKLPEATVAGQRLVQIHLATRDEVLAGKHLIKIASSKSASLLF